MAIVATSSLAAATVAPSGIRGTVIKGPISPVCREGVPCSAPAGGVALVVIRNGRTVATPTTSATGTYRVALKPGIYTIRSLRRSMFGSLAPHTVRVVAGRFTVANFQIDTGIR